MNKERDRKQWDIMIKSLTDVDEIAKNRKKEEIKSMLEEKVSDTGL